MQFQIKRKAISTNNRKSRTTEWQFKSELIWNRCQYPSLECRVSLNLDKSKQWFMTVSFCVLMLRSLSRPLVNVNMQVYIYNFLRVLYYRWIASQGIIKNYVMVNDHPRLIKKGTYEGIEKIFRERVCERMNYYHFYKHVEIRIQVPSLLSFLERLLIDYFCLVGSTIHW